MPSDRFTSEPRQAGRDGQLDTPLGPDKLVLTRFEAQEGLSELFEFRIEAISTERNIGFDRLIGKNSCVSFVTYDGGHRHFNGVVVEAAWTGIEQQHYSYRLIFRPWFWLLGRKADCRIFAEKTVFDIIEEVFGDGGFSDYEIKAARGDYPKIPYCVQYRETDLAFLSRLMEEWGIYYFHRHEQGGHTLVLADSRSCHSPVKIRSGKVPFLPHDGRDNRAEEHIYEWVPDRKFRTGKMATNDFDYMKPSADLKADSRASEKYTRADLEAYDYPGRYTERDVGKRRATVRLQAEQAQDRRKLAVGDAVSLYPGGLFDLARHPTDDAQYLVVRSSHRVSMEQYRTGGGGGDLLYRGTYEVLPADRPYRAPLVTPKTLVRGPQTAMVVARKGYEKEEIDVDEEGRIFVQFHWNRDKDRISRPVRVAQMFSGKGWGWQVIPRVGQEVVVDFLEGDPDQPIVVGTVYNKDYRYPYDLPDNKTISGVKTDSSKGHNGYNEFVFEDKKKEENIKMRAEKDHDTVIRHAETRVVGETFEIPVGSPSHSTTIKKGDMKLDVQTGNWNADVAMALKFTAKLMMTFEVGGSSIVLTPAGIIVKAPIISLN